MVIKPGGKYWNEADVHTHPLLQLVSVHHSQYKVNTWESDDLLQGQWSGKALLDVAVDQNRGLL